MKLRAVIAGGDLQAGRFEHGGSDVGEADEGVRRAAAFDLGGPADGERLARAAVVAVGLAAGEGHAVVAGHDHQRVRRPARGLERLEHLAQVAVEPLDREVVVQQVAPDLGRIGEIGRDDHVLDLHPGLHALALLVRAMGIAVAEPEAERLFLRHRLEKVGEAFHVRPAGLRSRPPA
jgi:serine/threonine protein kinase HipA of HipAB toxin-antitoxin module